MKAFIIALTIYTSVFATIQLSTQVGQLCATSNLFKIVSFDVTPWPPALGRSSDITIIGEILANNTGISQIVYGIENAYNQWNYNTQIVDQSYNIYEAVIFQNSQMWPFFTGNYILQTTIFGLDYPASTIGCWVVAFNL